MWPPTVAKRPWAPQVIVISVKKEQEDPEAAAGSGGGGGGGRGKGRGAKPPAAGEALPAPTGAQQQPQRGDGGAEAGAREGGESDRKGVSESHWAGQQKARHPRRSAFPTPSAHTVAGDSAAWAPPQAPAACTWLLECIFTQQQPPAGGGAAAGAAEEAEHRRKAVIFAHHRDVMDALQAEALEKIGGRASAVAPCAPAARRRPGARRLLQLTPVCVSGRYVRIDGETDPQSRQEAVRRFRSDPACVAALVSVTAGGVGLDLSSADCAVFAELPPEVRTPHSRLACATATATRRPAACYTPPRPCALAARGRRHLPSHVGALLLLLPPHRRAWSSRRRRASTARG